MDKFVAIVIGALCGVGQFFILRYTLKPLEKGGNPRIGIMMLMRLPLPLALLIGCAAIDFVLLAFTGGAFCLGLIIASVINHFAMLKKKG